MGNICSVLDVGAMGSEAEMAYDARGHFNAGDYVEMVSMDDPYPIEPGDRGRVTSVSGPPVNVVGVKWESGRSLNFCPEVDVVRVLERA